MITGEDDDGVFFEAGFAQRRDDAADLGIEEGDVGVIVGQVLANELRRARPGGEPLVAPARSKAMLTMHRKNGGVGRVCSLLYGS